MTNEEAIKILTYAQRTHFFGSHAFYEAYELAKEALRNQQEWIPCSKQIPPQQMVVIYSTKNNIVRAGTHEAGEWWDLDYQHALHDVIAWQLMPEPYKGGETE